jgi:hypothetical protein
MRSTPRFFHFATALRTERKEHSTQRSVATVSA